MSDDNKIFNLGEHLKGVTLKDIASSSDFQLIRPDYLEGYHKTMEVVDKANEERWKKEEEKEAREKKMLSLMEAMHDNVLAIRNNSDTLVFSMDELIDVIVVSNKITEANLLLIERELEKIVANGKLDVIDEIKRTALGIATQTTLAAGYVFLLKALPYIDNFLKSILKP